MKDETDENGRYSRIRVYGKSHRNRGKITSLKKGDKVVVPFTIAYGNCFYCKQGLWSACDNSNPTPEDLYSFADSGLFGLFKYDGRIGAAVIPVNFMAVADANEN